VKRNFNSFVSLFKITIATGQGRVAIIGWLNQASPVLRRLVHCKTPRRRFRALRRLGVSERTVFAAMPGPKGAWRMSFTGALHRGLTNARFRRLGLPTMAPLVKA
jgi:hypothetical protein